MGAALNSERGWDLLRSLCDEIGARISGSPELDQAIEWSAGEMAKSAGVAVERQPVQVPKWVRGDESLELIAPREKPLAMLGLGMSVGTPSEGIEADVVVVSSAEELSALGRTGVEGKIVLFDVPFTTYGETVRYRVRGPSDAAELGAVASLVRSVTPVSLNTPHTGTLRYRDGVAQIPAAAITVEDAEWLHRLQDRGITPRVRLKMSAELHGDVPSANVIGELRGRERPDEVVVVSCHLDSWDVGQGAQDDGAGCVMAMEALRLIAELDYRPRRSIRAVLFTNEENGTAGGAAYAAERGRNHVAALEADVGCGPARGWRLDLRGSDGQRSDAATYSPVLSRLEPLSQLLEALEAPAIRPGYGGADIKDLAVGGTPAFGLDMDTSDYWQIHHTEADTLEKIDPHTLRRNTAVMAVTTFWLAEMEGRLRD